MTKLDPFKTIANADVENVGNPSSGKKGMGFIYLSSA